MSPKLKYLSINWEDGMKINKNHFIQQENVSLERINDVAAGFLNNKNYGLLPIDQELESSIKTTIKIDNQEFLKVKIFICRAISPGGARIEILEEHSLPEFEINISAELQASAAGEGDDYFVLLSVDSFNKQPFGELNAEEEPPRYPYLFPGFKINLLPEKKVANTTVNPYSFYIGKLFLSKDKPEIIDDYIPPCRTINSHNDLIVFYNSVEKFFSKLELALLSIIRKIKEKNQESDLAQSVHFLAQKLLEYVTRNHLRLKWEIPDAPPILLFEYIATSAREIRNAIDSLPAAHKEEMLNYFTNWSELKQGDFEKLLVYCVNFEYQHYDIITSIEQFTEFIQIIATLFDKLDSLAYIGKKKETNIFVKEQKTKKRSFLAD